MPRLRKDLLAELTPAELDDVGAGVPITTQDFWQVVNRLVNTGSPTARVCVEIKTEG